MKLFLAFFSWQDASKQTNMRVLSANLNLFSACDKNQVGSTSDLSFLSSETILAFFAVELLNFARFATNERTKVLPLSIDS